MATASHILVAANDTGFCGTKHDEATAAKLTQLLQDDFQTHHVFFNSAGYHNHIVHHLFSLYDTGALTSILQAAYDANKTYQLQPAPIQDDVVAELEDWPRNAHKFLGRGQHYSNFRKFFQLEIEKHGWEAVILDFLCLNTPKSRDMVQRLFAGILHPMIQLMYGLEWEQPAIMAAGLAQAAVHPNSLGTFFDQSDAAAEKMDRSGVPVQFRSLSEVCERVRAEYGTLTGLVRWDGPEAFHDGVSGKMLQESVALAATLRVREDEIEERIAENLHHNAFVAAAAASWNPPHVPKYDFFLIHSLNAVPLLRAFNKPFIPTSAKIRIIEYKMRYDVMEYVARGSPPLDVSSIRNYKIPEDQDAGLSGPSDLLPRLHRIMDEGHVVKVARSLLLAEQSWPKWSGKPWIRMDQDQDWLKAQHMLLVGTEEHHDRWVRDAGHKEAWKNVPNKL